MIPKFRAWMPSLQWMCEVLAISWDDKYCDVCYLGDTERNTEMTVDFDEIELIQSTGLFDANGREVFAGDIVLINRPPFDCQGVVKYYNGCWWIVCGGIAFSLYDEVEESLVIGNIYENPELVEG